MRSFVPLIIATTLCAATLGLATTASAQFNAETNLIDSPYKLPPGETSFVGETVICSIPLGGPGTSLFGVDTVDPDADPLRFITGEINAPFRIFLTDQACNSLMTWNTSAGAATSMTGIAAGDPLLETYWAVHPLPTPLIREYRLFTGVPTGRVCLLPTSSPGPFGPAVIDSNVPGEIAYVEDLTSDQVFGIDLSNCNPVCMFRNPDNDGRGAFGNGIGDAAFPQQCAGATLVISSGMRHEGGVTRVSQINCNGDFCPDKWDLTQVGGGVNGFINGIDEFRPTSSFAGGFDEVRYIVVVDNLTGEKRIVCKPVGLAECQGDDPEGNILQVNGSSGGFDFTVPINPAGSVTTTMLEITGSNRKFVFHFNEGIPDGTTVTPLLDLGNSCFPFVGGMPKIVANNIGKTNAVGASSYFGVSAPDPAKAPTFISPTQVTLDTMNIPSGTFWTGQGVAHNPNATSVRGASLTNAIVYEIE